MATRSEIINLDRSKLSQEAQSAVDSEKDAITAAAIVLGLSMTAAEVEANAHFRAVRALEERKARFQAEIAEIDRRLGELTTEREQSEPTGR